MSHRLSYQRTLLFLLPWIALFILVPMATMYCTLQRDYVLTKAFQIWVLNLFFIKSLCTDEIIIDFDWTVSAQCERASTVAFSVYDILEVSNKHVGDNNLACRQRSKPAVSLLAWKSIQRQSGYESRQHAKAVCCTGGANKLRLHLRSALESIWRTWGLEPSCRPLKSRVHQAGTRI